MKFAVEEIQKVKVLHLNERRLDTHIAPDLKAELLILLDQGPHNVLVDLKKVGYADSSGLGALLFGLRQAKAKGGLLKIMGTQHRVLSLIRIAQLEGVLQNFETEEEAILSFDVNT